MQIYNFFFFFRRIIHNLYNPIHIVVIFKFKALGVSKYFSNFAMIFPRADKERANSYEKDHFQEKMKEINYKDLKFNPFSLIGDEWMLVTAGNMQKGCNTMTASWGGLGCLWGHNNPVATIYIRPSRYTKELIDRENGFTLNVMDKSFKKQMAYLGNVSGRDEDKIGKTGLTPVYEEGAPYFAEAKLVLICRKMYAQPLDEHGFFYKETIEQNYPLRDFHTMYIGEIEKVLARDDEYLK